MDLFGKKATTLENVINSQKATIRRLAASELEAQRKIRDMDQLIFAMGQCSNWPEMQAIFIKLKDMTDARMIDESNRIKQVLIPEMQKAYRSKDSNHQDEPSIINDQTPLVRSRFDVGSK